MSNQPEFIFVNIFVINIWAFKEIKVDTNISKEAKDYTPLVRELNTPLTSMDRSSRKKKNLTTLSLKWHIRLDGLNRYRTFKAAEYTFPGTCRPFFFRIDYVLVWNNES